MVNRFQGSGDREIGRSGDLKTSAAQHTSWPVRGQRFRRKIRDGVILTINRSRRAGARSDAGYGVCRELRQSRERPIATAWRDYSVVLKYRSSNSTLSGTKVHRDARWVSGHDFSRPVEVKIVSASASAKPTEAQFLLRRYSTVSLRSPMPKGKGWAVP